MSDDQGELVSYLLAQGHSEERAQQIAGNHADAVRTEMSANQQQPPAVPPAPPAPPATEEAPQESLPHEVRAALFSVNERLTELEQRHERLVDHVNRELGVAEDVPLVQLVRAALANKAATPAPIADVSAPAAPAPALEVTHGEEKQETAPAQEERAVPQT